jgi:hypothetical protein
MSATPIGAAAVAAAKTAAYHPSEKLKKLVGPRMPRYLYA